MLWSRTVDWPFQQQTWPAICSRLPDLGPLSFATVEQPARHLHLLFSFLGSLASHALFADLSVFLSIFSVCWLWKQKFPKNGGFVFCLMCLAFFIQKNKTKAWTSHLWLQSDLCCFICWITSSCFDFSMGNVLTRASILLSYSSLVGDTFVWSQSLKQSLGLQKISFQKQRVRGKLLRFDLCFHSCQFCIHFLLFNRQVHKISILCILWFTRELWCNICRQADIRSLRSVLLAKILGRTKWNKYA